MRIPGRNVTRVTGYMGKLLDRFIQDNRNSRGFTFFEGETAASLLDRDDLDMWLWTEYGAPTAYGHIQRFPHNSRKQGVCRFGVCVDKDERGKGIGTGVVSFLMQQAEMMGMRKIVATVYEDNGPMMHIYTQRHGFREEGCFVGEEDWGGELRNVLSLARWL